MRKILFLLPVFSVIVLLYACVSMLETPTMILPSWILLMFYLIIVLGVSFLVGGLLKKILRSDLPLYSFASIFVFVTALTYIILNYRPTFRITFPVEYVGQVKLFATDKPVGKTDLNINQYGVGYISKENYEEGFYPKIFKGGRDITSEIKAYYKSSFQSGSTVGYQLDYLSFQVGPDSEQKLDINQLIKLNAIDTARLRK